MTEITKVDKFSAHTNVNSMYEESDVLMNEIQEDLDGVKWLTEIGVSEEMIFEESPVEWYIKLNNWLEQAEVM